MKLDRRRLLRLLGLAAWAAFFDYLWIADEANRYVGERTGWVVPFGGIVLTLTALGYALTIRADGHTEPPGRKDLAGVVALLAPVLLVVVIPAPSLGALAVDKKSTNRVSASAEEARGRQGEVLTILDVSAASSSPEFARVRGVKAGLRVSLLGFVSAATSTGFTLARFQASCCAADAIPYTAKVQPASATDVEIDQWVRAEGTLSRTPGGKFVVDASSVEVVDEPSEQYLTQ